VTIISELRILIPSVCIFVISRQYITFDFILKVAVIVMVTEWPQKIIFFEDRMNF